MNRMDVSRKQQMTADGALSKEVLTNTILAHLEAELSPEMCWKAFNTIVRRHLMKWLHAVLYNWSLEKLSEHEVDLGCSKCTVASFSLPLPNTLLSQFPRNLQMLSNKGICQ